MAEERFISAYIAATILGLSHKHVERMCRNLVFKTAHKPGMGRKAHWKILRAEVVAHKFDSHAQLIEQ